jgi:polyprenyl-phospho-N-acetylgalactosaminyl synthase
MKIFVVIAAYNEEKRIGRVINDLLKNKYTNIVVVDDGSTDNTFKIIKNTKVYALKHILNRGQGAALKTGIDFAISKNADVIVTYDADGQFLVKEIKKVIKPIIDEHYDVVLGSRFMGKTINIRPLKKIVLKLGVFVVYILYGIKVTDSQCGFRSFSKYSAKKIGLKSDRMEHAGEIFWEIKKNKLKYVEVPITVIYDKYTINKGQSWTKSIELGIRMLFRRFFL